MIIKAESLFVVVHTHEHGTSVTLVGTPSPALGKAEAIAALDEEYEPERGEVLEIVGPLHAEDVYILKHDED